MKRVQYIALVGGMLSIAAFSHLVYNVHTTHVTSNLTFAWIALVFCAQSLMLTYGLLTHAIGIVLPACILLLGVSYVASIKLRYGNGGSSNAPRDVAD